MLPLRHDHALTEEGQGPEGSLKSRSASYVITWSVTSSKVHNFSRSHVPAASFVQALRAVTGSGGTCLATCETEYVSQVIGRVVYNPVKA